MAQLSAVEEAYQKQAGQRFHSGTGVRSNARQPARQGTTRGTMGVIGSTTLQTRNPDAKPRPS